LGGGPADHSVRLGVVSGALFLGSNRVRSTLLMACKRLPRAWTVRKKHTQGVHGLAWEAYMLCVSGFPLYGVHQFESPRLSDMSNRLFVAISTSLINGLMFINELWLYFTLILVLLPLFGLVQDYLD
jgi:hypothetical protein